MVTEQQPKPTITAGKIAVEEKNAEKKDIQQQQLHSTTVHLINDSAMTTLSNAAAPGTPHVLYRLFSLLTLYFIEILKFI